MKTCCHQSGDVSHIHHEHCAHLVSHFPEFLKVDGAGICGGTCNDHLGLSLQSDPAQLIIIDKAVIIYAVRNDLEIFTGHIHR